jgi:peroxiredoxin
VSVESARCPASVAAYTMRVTRFVAALALAFLALAPASGAAAPAAPAVRVPLITGGEPFDSRSLMGKKVLVLRFQASWCKACATQAAGIQRIYERYKERGVELLALQVDDPEKEARAFLRAHRATYPAALDPSQRVANRFGFKRAPYTVIVNKRGEIAARLEGSADEARLAAAIDSALKPPTKRGAPARAS